MLAAQALLGLGHLTRRESVLDLVGAAEAMCALRILVDVLSVFDRTGALLWQNGPTHSYTS